MIEKKVKKNLQLKKLVRNLKKSGKKIVFTNGCFDILHLGHVEYLESAKKHGDVLIVAVNSDASVRKIKGANRPIKSQKERARIIAALESVNFVTIFNEDTPYNLIKGLKPDILVKGADWKKKNIAGSDLLKKYGGRLIRIKFKKGYSSSRIIQKIFSNAIDK